MNDYYYKLGLEKNASLNDIKNSYRKLSKALHPDKNNSEKFYEEILKEINEAYEILSNAQRRKKYDYEYSRFTSNNGSESNFIKIELNKVIKEKNILLNEIKILKNKILDLKSRKQNDNESYFLKNELNKYFKEKKELQRKIIELEKGKNNKTNYSFIFYAVILIMLGFFYFQKNTESKKSKTIVSNNNYKDFQNKIENLEIENQKLKTEKNSYLKEINKSKSNKKEFKIANSEKKVNDTKSSFIYKGNYLYKSKTFSFAQISNDKNLKNKLYKVDNNDYIYVLGKEKKGVYKIWYLGAFGYISEGMLKNK